MLQVLSIAFTVLPQSASFAIALAMVRNRVLLQRVKHGMARNRVRWQCAVDATTAGGRLDIKKLQSFQTIVRDIFKSDQVSGVLRFCDYHCTSPKYIVPSPSDSGIHGTVYFGDGTH